MKRTPDEPQPPQASASTNSAIRAGCQFPDEKCLETAPMSSATEHVEKFQDGYVGAQIREVRPGNKTRSRAMNDRPLSLAFRIVCMAIGMATLVAGVLIADTGTTAAGAALFAWTLGYLWGEANAYFDTMMRKAQP